MKNKHVSKNYLHDSKNIFNGDVMCFKVKFDPLKYKVESRSC